MRSTIEAALTACAEDSLKGRVRRFLTGLSSDELYFIADFLGACIVESGELEFKKVHVTVRLAQFQANRVRRSDQEHKMLVLLEYLCRSGMKPKPIQQSAKQA